MTHFYENRVAFMRIAKGGPVLKKKKVTKIVFKPRVPRKRENKTGS